MNAWGDEDRPPVEPSRRRRRVHGWHYVALGVLLTAAGGGVAAASSTAVGPVLLTAGLMLVTFGGLGWAFEALGSFDDDPDARSGIGLNDVAHLARKNRRH